ncbi:MAG: helicase-exonuclease AddAB subunit AddA [Planctomycetes bacterium]|nr:helicase-exonuclease AddAB subunit AddA [Planctomycetota bacterium]
MRTDGKSILVSASAGTGKTRVLVDRCLRLVLEAGVDLDRILVVTFTDAAAAEMRERIRRELQANVESNPFSERLRAQLLFLDRAQISTIHSFCLNTLRENFHKIGLDPGFSVIDQDEADLLKKEAARELFDGYYAREDATGQQFQQLVSCYGGRDADADLRALVIALHEFSHSLPDPQAWLTQARETYSRAARARRLEDTFWFPKFKEQVVQELEAAALEFEFAIEALKGSPFNAAYGPVAQERRETVRQWLRDIEKGRFEEVCRKIRDHDFGRLPSLREVDKEEKEKAQALVHRGKIRINEELQNALCRDKFEAMLGLFALVEPHVTLLVNLVEEFAERYEREKEALPAVDFNDLEQLMLKLLRHEDTVRMLRDRFEHVLVDEYQDINPVQDAILETVSRIGDADRPGNLFAVGDVKQSIYRFRLAEPEIFIRKYESYRDDGSDTARIHLKENFRSRERLLAAVNAVFDRIMQPSVARVAYDEGARLEYAADYSPASSGPPMEFHLLDMPKHRRRSSAEEEEEGRAERVDIDKVETEARFVAERIERMVGGRAEFNVRDTQTGEDRDVTYRDIVILLRTTRDRAVTYCQALAERGIPTHSDLASGYFTSMEIEDMLNLLRIIDNPRQDIPLAAVLRSPIVGLREAELARVRLADEEGDFYQAATAAAKMKNTHGEKLHGFLTGLDAWRTAARRRPLAELIYRLYAETGYLNYVAGLHNGAQRQANLLRLHDRACQFDRFAHHGLARFLRFVEDLIEAGSDFGSAPVLSEAENAVRVMSIHKSKGLEFPVVFLPDLAKTINFSDCSGDLIYDRDQLIGAQALDVGRGVRHVCLSHRVASRQLRMHTIAEEMRVLYVAMTRARERLVLSAGADAASVRAKWGPVLRAGEKPPAFALADARSMLDWIWPALAGTECGKFATTKIHTGEDVAKYAEAKAVALSPKIDRKKIERMAPLDDAPPPSDAVRRAAEQIAWTYPAAGLERVRAKLTVSELKHRHDLAHEDDEISSRLRQSLTERPAFLTAGPTALSGAERGTAVHTVMRWLDLSLDLAKPETVEEEIERVRERGLLTDAEAESVDAGAVAAFFATDPGKQILGDPSRVRRELPFTLAKKIGEVFPGLPEREREEAMLLQGIIDCLIETDDGFLLLDFKTDDVSAEEISARIQEGGYATQLSHYADAVARIFGRPVRVKYLYFFTPREIVALE